MRAPTRREETLLQPKSGTFAERANMQPKINQRLPLSSPGSSPPAHGSFVEQSFSTSKIRPHQDRFAFFRTAVRLAESTKEHSDGISQNTSRKTAEGRCRHDLGLFDS